ncbi:MAG TPA: RodZ domain-containing protein [Chloroflexota bacterium]|nr:RodZ domain-containing protein [Chloroflexota bacterium]
MGDGEVNQANGDRLRRERLHRRLTLAQVEQQTRIRQHYLAAIEDDDIKSLPAPVFAIGLISTYARFFGFEPGPFIATFKERLGVPLAPQVRPETARFVPPPTRVPAILWPGIGVVVLILLAGYLYQQVALYASGANIPPTPASLALMAATPLPTPPTPPPTATAIAPAVVNPTSVAIHQIPTATAQPSPSPTQVTAVPTATPSQGVRIDATVSGRVWVQVEADGNVVFSGILQGGDKHTWTASRTLMIWSGNAGNVAVTYNGKPLGPLGPPGEVVKVTWTATA